VAKGIAIFVRGYHVYQVISEVAVGEVLLYERESGGVTDRYIVAVKKERMIIGHLTRRCHMFAHFS